MANCILCGRHYFLSPFNETQKCDACLDVLDDDFIDEETDLELEQIINRSGKTPARIDDDNDVESFSS